MGILAVNGFEPNVIITGITRNASVLDGPNAGRGLDGVMIRDIIGTFYNYNISCSAKLDDPASYDAFYEIITAPSDSISLTVPYGQGLITFNAYVASTNDALVRDHRTGKYFGKLTFDAVSIDPQRTGGSGGGAGTRKDAPFRMDGVGYQMLVSALSRSSTVLDGEEAGRVMSGHMERDIIGTYYNYSAQITALSRYLNEYDSFYESVTAPIDSHAMTFPYGTQTISLDAYVAAASDKLTRVSNGHYYWSGLSLDFVAMRPARTP